MDLFDVFGSQQGKAIYEPAITKQIKINNNYVNNNNNMTIEYEGQQDNTVQNQMNNEIQQDKNDLNYFDILHTKEECGCVHEEFYPSDFVRFNKVPDQKPAKQYPFKLDSFQSTALKALEMNESVLVAAHTSAGKTAVAEYAIAMAKRDGQRVVYTSPIKALSNQKYRELQQEFQDVGLVTGDVTINQNAFCLVMTTEILRSMLYRGSEIVREVQWVIFDEVHYMRDRERGVVWEETLILLNPNVRYVFLSATIPNASEFAEWICRIKHQPCHVVYTEYRPTPLQHYICPSGADGIYLVVDELGRFRDDKFQEAITKLEEGGGDLDGGRKKKKPTEGSDLFKLMKLIKERNMDPAIIFSFSKKEVEGYAMAMSKMDLTSQEEKEKIEHVYTNAMLCLSDEDRQLPQIQLMMPILKKGIGIHHGGLLPIVKEIIEILFQEGWLKALFSTETFSMGLNMPSKTVVFTSVRKFDGETFRWIGGGEYIQMSGRAGRRGIDDKGICILVFDQKMDQDVAKNMLKGNPDPLNSSFHLSYNMLINSIRIEDTDPEYIIRRSFHQFQSGKQLPEMKAKLLQLKQQSQDLQIQSEESIEQLFILETQFNKLKEASRKLINQPKIVLPFLAIGRLVYIKSSEQDWGWGVYLNFMQKRVGMKKNQQQEQLIVLDVMLHIKPRRKNDAAQSVSYDEAGEMEVIPVLLEQLYDISSVKLNLPNDLKDPKNKQLVKQTIIQLHKQFKGSIPLIDPISDMKIQDDDLDKLLKQQQKLLKEKQKYHDQLVGVDIHKCMLQFEQRQKITQSIELIEQQIQQGEQMILVDDLRRMKRVMRRLGWINKDDIVELKGKVACEVSACDEIIITELLFTGIFQDINPPEIAALLTCLIYDENNSSQQAKFVIKNEKLSKYFNEIMAVAQRIFQVYQDCKINIEEPEYLAQFKPQLMEVTLAWCQGQTFAQICKLTDVFEGSIIRCLRRLDELLKQLQKASEVIGNKQLEEKFQESSKLLKRGIVFAASLYL